MVRDGNLRWLLIFAFVILIQGCSLFDFLPPEIKIISPKDGATVYGAVILEAEVKDAHLDRTEVFVNGKKEYEYKEKDIIDTLNFAEICQYIIRLKAFDVAGNWKEEEVKFMVFASDSGVPILINPSNDAWFWNAQTLDVDFSWSTITGATEYNIQVDNSSSFSSPIINDNIGTTSYNWSYPDSGEFYWRVRAGKGVGWGPWSSVSTFERGPYEVGCYDTPGTAEGVFVSGFYAYVADRSYGLRVIDVSDPSNPQEVGSYDTPDYAYEVFVSSPYAYVADYASGLRIIDVSSPSNPNEVGYYDTTGSAKDVFVSGSYAYVADGDSGLRVIDVSNPSSPQGAGSYNTPYLAVGIYIAGYYAYMAACDGLHIIDVTIPSNPQLVGYYETPGNAFGVNVSGSYAYVADLGYGLRIIDVSTPSNPNEVGYYDTPGCAKDVFVSGSYAYVVDCASGLRIIDVSNPANPNEVGYYDTLYEVNGVYVLGLYAYVANGDSGLRIIKIGH